MHSKPITILLIEDNLADADLLQEILAETDDIEWQVVHVEKLKEGLKVLKENHFDVILLDLSLPDKQGLATVSITHEEVPDLPIVVLTGFNDKVTALEALRKGAQDYLTKGQIDNSQLVRTIRYAIERTQTLKKLRQSEEQLQQLNEELEQRVEQQTDELRQKNQCLEREISERQRLEEELRKALAKEKELSDLKSNIISVVSHDYRTPLTTILSSAELLQNYSDRLSQEKRQRHLQKIQSSVHHLTQLVSDVLIISKAEAGKLEFNPEFLDIVEFCYDLVEEFTLTQTTGHRINFSYHGSCKSACLDEKLLRQILSNLLSNAIKYSPQGGEVQFGLVFELNSVIFRLKDSGIGIPKKDQSQLFQSFYRSSNVGGISGTGLGLAIVKKCVDVQGGQIIVESEVGVGTTFTVTLPLVPQGECFQVMNYEL